MNFSIDGAINEERLKKIAFLRERKQKIKERIAQINN